MIVLGWFNHSFVHRVYRKQRERSHRSFLLSLSAHVINRLLLVFLLCRASFSSSLCVMRFLLSSRTFGGFQNLAHPTDSNNKIPNFWSPPKQLPYWTETKELKELSKFWRDANVAKWIDLRWTFVQHYLYSLSRVEHHKQTFYVQPRNKTWHLWYW